VIETARGVPNKIEWDQGLDIYISGNHNTQPIQQNIITRYDRDGGVRGE
jgi:hypothetical protein